MTIKATAITRSIRISPSKVRRIADLIRNSPCLLALELLELCPYRGSDAVHRLVKSACAHTSLEKGISPQSLYISRIEVDKGPVLKRFRPRAKGRGFAIQKMTSQIRIQLSSIEVD